MKENQIKIKLCGLRRPNDIKTANELRPDYIGFVFAKKSKRYVSSEQAASLKKLLHPDILAVGVFVNEQAETVAELLSSGVIDVAQLHGGEDETYMEALRRLTDRPLIKAFSVKGEEDIRNACASTAELVLLDAGEGGTGTAFDRTLLQNMNRPYLLAGGLDASTVGEAVKRWRPYGVDVSSGIETDGYKDPEKMRAFVGSVREMKQ